MIDHIRNLSGKRILLLQGPVGPFFARLAADLRGIGAQVFKVNFNAGDWFFYRRGAFSYRGAMEDWPTWFAALIDRLDINVVLLFGDCRPIHRSIHAIAVERGVKIGVFEEGYVRPDYVTLECFGVNGYSPLFRKPDFLREEPASVPAPIPVGNTYWAMVWHGGWYFGMGGLGKPLFPRYRHHRALTITEILPWIRSAWRKLWYRRRERGIQEALASRWSGQYFLVPLQVFNDYQLTMHADWDSMEHFIETTLRSFAEHAPDDTLLVFKHHPLERGYRDYTALIGRLSINAGVSKRVHYIHDQHLPTLLAHARGVIIVNSTVGLSAIDHGVPTKACGRAIYDVPGLTFQGPLDEFWTKAPSSAGPDRDIYRRFRANLIARTQLNGSFYKPFERPGAFAGLVWRRPSPEKK
uniref:Capsular polysaccharide export protein n=1 Tax=Candidatus Kentrum sp. DK TaxID=2126562 RepID=A0A450TNG3_9GAMM|nr:MAG: capsular polysaccharide export protein [Candidatus Kentron sp. DK]VFJ69416.1 MAG: capsular polysaccharide export protein [Candidatus Kentron sp. DK]